MISLDHYKQLLALTNFQYEQARQLISDFTDQGILLGLPATADKPEHSFLESKATYQARNELYDALQFRQYSLAIDLEYQVAALLCELNLPADNSQEARALFGHMLLETKPFVKRLYANWGVDDSAYRAPDFNLVLLWYSRIVLNGWAIPASLSQEMVTSEGYEEASIPATGSLVDQKSTDVSWDSIIELQTTLGGKFNPQAELDSLTFTSNDTDAIGYEVASDIDLDTASQSDQFIAMFKDHFPTDSQADRFANPNPPVAEG
ncbi:hypothetical protein [Spirosoma jeollabukense]